ncbi:hypothetical protein [Hymenobacter sp. DG25A]|uniref:hypothetical protein n=1 Tax=Hymenobacter sp. DG25A TaxID=1385663 RepID=UPI0006BCEB05|nr:hypothetical protein [Hymenobacter sp. DG25A]ALD22229.1 hypothetical protein AM218_14670 [Hymenobacter sp. DG25A]
MLFLLTSAAKHGGQTLTLGLSLLLSSCQEKAPAVVEQPKPAVEKPIPPATPAPAAPRVACTLVDDAVAEEPFEQEITTEELLADGGTVEKRTPVKNRHVEGQVDTLITIRHHHNRFEYYQTPEKDLLQQVTITDFSPIYGKQLRTKLGAAYKARYAKKTGRCDSLRIGDTNRLNTVALTMRNGQVNAVQIEYYVD